MVTSTHLLNHLAVRPSLGKKCNKVQPVRKDLSAEGSQVAAVEHETPLNNDDVHTCFESVELDSVSATRKKWKWMCRFKADTSAEATVRPL